MSKKEKGKPTLRVFFSYAAADRAYAAKLRSLLSQRPNLRIFTTDILSAGENWESRLKSELSECDIFVVLLSPHSLESKWVLHELGAAWGLQKPIIPVVTDPEVFAKLPVALSEVQLVDIKNLDSPEAVNQIFERYEEEIATAHNGG
jgi:hypothetical protein